MPSPKIYDWSKTLSEQKLKEGDPIIVEGIAYNIFPYTYDDRFVLGEVVHVASLKLDLSPTELPIFLTDPDTHILDRIAESPVAIGAVVGTIHNPMFNKDIAQLLEVYPHTVPLESKESAKLRAYIEKIGNKEDPPSDLRLRSHLNIEHRFRFKGIIQGFQRRTHRGISMLCMDISVSDMTLIETKKVNEKSYD